MLISLKTRSKAKGDARRPKVIIVGAGPAGSASAIELRRRDAAEVVVLDRSIYPRRKVCGSGLSPMALTQLRHLDMLDELRDVHIDMRAMRVIGPAGGTVDLAGAKGAWVVPRSELDHRLIQRAVRLGATLEEGRRVRSVLHDSGGRVRGVATDKGELEADLVIFATGSPSAFEIDDTPRQGIRTIMGWWTAQPREDLARMIWDDRLAGYYAWSFPEPNGVVNIGLTIPEGHDRSSHLRELFSELLADHFADLTEGNEQIGKWAGHPATVTTRVGKIVTPRSMYVGEAARLVCPATVEGISFALESGRLAADAIDRSFDTETGFSTAAQQRYRMEVSTHMLPKFLVGEAMYRVMRSPNIRGRLTQIVSPGRIAAALTHFVGERSKAA